VAEMPISMAFREVCECRAPDIYRLLGYGCCWRPADASDTAQLHPPAQYTLHFLIQAPPRSGSPH
jgi:hypothetical protein